MAQYFPEIPTRIYVTGNIQVGQRYIGLGRQRLDILFRSLELSGLPHGFNTRTLSDGTIIKATVSFGVSTINISSPTTEPRGDGWCSYECQCYPCFIMGKITNVSLELNYKYSYSVEMCKGSGQYSELLLFENFPNITSFGFEKYEVGQYVFLTTSAPDIISDDSCLFDLVEEFGVEAVKLNVVPIYNTANMTMVQDVCY